MLTDHEARALLQAAADTIDVSGLDESPLPTDDRGRRWPILAAAAAVLAVLLATTTLVAIRHHDQPPTDRRGDHVVIPGVLGYDRTEARDLLQHEGLEVEVTTEPSCSPPIGMAIVTEPAQGAKLERGDRVTLRVSSGAAPTDECTDDSSGGYDLLRLARGLPSDVTFADHVAITTTDGSKELTRAEAADPDHWEVCAGGGRCDSPLAALVTEADLTRTTVVDGSSEAVAPLLRYTLADQPAEKDCVPDLPQQLVDRPFWYLGLKSSRRSFIPFLCGPVDLAVFRVGDRADGAIDAVVLRHPGDAPTSAPTPASTSVVPSVLGYDEQQAQDLLERLGIDVTVHNYQSCRPPGEAVATDPIPGTTVSSGQTVTLDVTSPTTGDLACLDSDPTGYDIVRFARGTGPPPAFADQVVVDDGQTSETLTGDARDVTARWGSLLERLVEQANLPRSLLASVPRSELRPRVDYYGVRPDRIDYHTRCRPTVPAEFAGRTSFWVLDVAASYDNPRGCPPFALVLFREGDRPSGAIDGATIAEPPAPPVLAPVPDVRGLTLDAAIATLRSAGIGYAVRAPEHKPYVVTAQQPSAGTVRAVGGLVLLTIGYRPGHGPGNP